MAQLNYLSKETGEGLINFVFKVAVPILIFCTIATADLSGGDAWSLWAAYFIGVVVAWSMGTIIIRRVFKRDARAGVVAGVSSAFSNAMLIGISMVLAAYGEAGASAVFVLLSVHLPIMMLAGTLLQERALKTDGLKAGKTSIKEILKKVGTSLVKNPIIIGILAGGFWYLLDLPVVGVPKILLERIGSVASTLALFAMGMSLHSYQISGNILPALVLSAIKLMVLPSVVLLTTLYVFPLSPIWVKAIVITAACPAGVNTFIIASYFKTGQALASNTITISTAISVVSVAFWLLVLEKVVG